MFARGKALLPSIFCLNRFVILQKPYRFTTVIVLGGVAWKGFLSIPPLSTSRWWSTLW